MTIKIKLAFAFVLALAVNIGIVMAAASFQVTSFSCSPSETVINSLFSCSATVQNTGDAAGTLSTATLYTDSADWLENSNYPQSYGQSVNPGSSVSISFSGLRATVSGNNGFSRIMLDSVTDTYVADNNKKVNVINVAVSVSNSASSAVMGGQITSSAEVTAGGNIDVSLTFASSSGGCSIGSQTNPKTISGMTDGSKQTRTFTVTQGTTGACQFTISAAATGAGGVASKIDSTPSTISCPDCPVSSSSSSSGGGGGGGGGAGGTAVKEYLVGEFYSPQMVSLSDGERAVFKVIGKNHTLTLTSHTNTSALVTIESEKQTFTLAVGDEINVDVTEDGRNDISVKLQGIDAVSGKVDIVLKNLLSKEEEESLVQAGESSDEGKEGPLINISPSAKKNIYLALVVLAVVLIVSAIVYLKARNKRKVKWGER